LGKKLFKFTRRLIRTVPLGIDHPGCGVFTLLARPLKIILIIGRQLEAAPYFYCSASILKKLSLQKTIPLVASFWPRVRIVNGDGR
jgi:hypothetical protein